MWIVRHLPSGRAASVVTSAGKPALFISMVSLATHHRQKACQSVRRQLSFLFLACTDAGARQSTVLQQPVACYCTLPPSCFSFLPPNRSQTNDCLHGSRQGSTASSRIRQTPQRVLAARQPTHLRYAWQSSRRDRKGLSACPNDLELISKRSERCSPGFNGLFETPINILYVPQNSDRRSSQR